MADNRADEPSATAEMDASLMRILELFQESINEERATVLACEHEVPILQAQIKERNEKV
jgi:ABC-type ATPase involved in cell division